MDIELENPKFYDIREPWKGINDKKDLTQVNDSHCVIAFVKIIKKKKFIN